MARAARSSWSMQSCETVSLLVMVAGLHVHCVLLLATLPSHDSGPILLTFALHMPCFMNTGGLAVYSGASALLVGSTLADCRGGLRGGGLRAMDANVTLKGSRVQRCHSLQGGGLSGRHCSMGLLGGSIITECTAESGSGMRAGRGRTCLLCTPHPIGLCSRSLHRACPWWS